ncbi:hypothetical protein GCK32_004683 [Trichostrongylus colubriformis]|uniref:Pre-mRNA-splicing factor 18 n=1 Tax=Trichostrongylus colubriformis TaxID=6319 RepID=A0AAN8EVT3_TRICO
MDVLKTLKEEMERKRKRIAELEVNVDGKKFIRGADLVAKQEEEYREKQKSKQANHQDSKEEESNTAESVAEGDPHLEKAFPDEIPLSEVHKRLRDRGQPILLFGEDETQVRARLLKLEIEQPDMKEGWKNEMQTAMRDVDEELVKEVIEGSSNDPNKHDVDLSSSFNDNWEKIEEQATLLGNDPHRDCDIILSFFKYLITRWGMELNRRDDEEKKSAEGKLQASIHKQTVMNLRPLLNSLENHSCNNDIRHHLTNICRLLIIDRNYILANNAYMTMAIGNAPWPVGVTRSGIHQRPGSAKAYVSNIAHVLNDETQRKYIQAFKRLMTRMQEYFPTDPSKCVEFKMSDEEVEDNEVGDMDMDEVPEDLDAEIAKVREEKFEDALSAVGLRVDVGGMIWQSYLCFEEAMLSADETNEEQRKAVASLYKRALRVPNVDLADTWKSYLEFAEKNDPGRIQAFYSRMLNKHSRNENVWFDYGQWCETKLKVHPITCRVYKQAVRHCPYSCALWQQTLLALERAVTPAAEIDDLWQKARETISSADDGRALYRTYLYMLRRRADCGDNNYTKVAENLVEWFGKHDWDPHAEYRRNWAYFAYNKLKDLQKGHKIWEDILSSGGGRFAEKWIEAVRLERQFGTVDGARKLLYKAINSVSDHPTIVFEYFIQFEREEGSLEQLDKALEKVNAQASQRASRVQTKKPKEEPAGKKVHGKERRVAENSVETKPSNRKRVGSDSEDTVPLKKQGNAPETSAPGSSGHSATSAQSSDKEQKYTVFISNLDFRTTPEQVKEVLDGVVDVRLVYRGMSKLTKGYGFVDLDSKKSLDDALAKDRVPIDGRPMLISISDPEKRHTFKYSTDLEKTKLFVRNVHYDCTEDQLRVRTEDRKLHVAISNPPKKPAKEEPRRVSSTPIASTSTDRKTHLTMVPRGVKTSSTKVVNGVIVMADPKSNGMIPSLDEEHLLAPFDYITSMPGKQIRGQLAMAFNIWLKIGPEQLSQIMEIVQMLHNASLLVDDIEDNSVLRRGLPVTHHIYGTPRTINTANYVYFIALEKCTRLSHEAVRIFAEQMLELHRGQGKELFWRDTVTCPTEAEYEEMVVQKTGGLFFLAVKLIELFSQSKYDFRKLLRQMALFFQIRDDYMNLFSDEMAKQKSFAEDLTEGKFSFPIIHAIRSSPVSSNDDPVLNILRQRTEDVEVKKYCIKLIKERHSLDYTLSRLRQISADIRAEIKVLGGNSKLEDVMDLLENGIVS